MNPVAKRTSEPFREVSSMQCNVGPVERWFRLGLGTAALAFEFAAPVKPGWKILGGVVAASGILTGITRYCPLNQALGINNCT